jgi:hypothetical protein
MGPLSSRWMRLRTCKTNGKSSRDADPDAEDKLRK